ncbi:MAG: RNA polymerase sigma factor [Deltaproteobacteria bacterium]|nr:RNA polymerase sigma factor [Deltaproteobacteria bacterium]
MSTAAKIPGAALQAVPASAPTSTETEPTPLQQLYREHSAAVARRLYRLCGDREVARDLTQDAFVVAMKRLDSLQDTTARSAWLHGIAYNLLREHRRFAHRRRSLWQRWRGKSTERAQAVAIEGGTDDEAQLLRTLDAALRGLDTDKRDAFVLRQLEGLSLEEAAGLLDVSVQTVSYRDKRAEAHVRAAFESPPTRSRPQ